MLTYTHGGVVYLKVASLDPLYGEVDEDPGDDPDDDESGEGAQHLGPVVAEGPPLPGLLLAQPQGEQAAGGASGLLRGLAPLLQCLPDPEAGEVAEHVDGVTHDGEGA